MAGIRIGGTAILAQQYIPFCNTDGQQWISVVTPDPGQDEVQISATTANAIAAPVLAPNSSLVAWKQQGGIRVVEPSGANETEIVNSAAGACWTPQWHPDSSHLIYVQNVGGTGTDDEIRRVDADGSNDTLVYTEPSNLPIGGCQYTYDGSKIVFSVLVNSTTIGVWVMDPDGSNATQLDTHPTSGGIIRQEVPLFPLGKANNWVTWNDNTVASPTWKRMDTDGTNVVTLWTFSAGFSNPVYAGWAPDDSVIYHHRDSSREIWSVPADGSAGSLVFDNASQAYTSGPWVWAQAPLRIYDVENQAIINDNLTSILANGTDNRDETDGTNTVSFVTV
jgi:hypothetical protein